MEAILAVCRQIRITDTRDANAGLVLADAHAAAINRVQWHPCDAHMMLSSAMDPFIHVFDLRRASKPVHRLSGHALSRQA